MNIDTPFFPADNADGEGSFAGGLESIGPAADGAEPFQGDRGMDRGGRDLEVIEALLALPMFFWQDYRPVALPPVLQQELDRADVALLQTLLVEIAFRLDDKRKREKGG